MKYLLLFLFIVSIIFISNGCDSGTDSKSISTTPPVLVYPYDNDSNVSVMTTFRWTGTADIVSIDLNPGFTDPVSYTVTGTSHTVSDPLSSYSAYYWKAGRNIGGTIYWSDNYYYFRTGN